MMDVRGSVSIASSPHHAAMPISPTPSAGDVVQPSKEWVLPARGKPGRKPAAEVPLTKRKAQNRASQRAFRERRQSYLTELEQKVKQYEAQEIDANIQMQRIALQCREEAAQLRQKNEALNTRCEQLEQQVKLLKEQHADVGLQYSSRGCLPPKHEHISPPLRENSKLSSMTSSSSSQPILGCKQENTRVQSTPSDTFSPIPAGVNDSNVSSEAEDMNFDCGFCPDQGLCVCRGKAQLHLEEEPTDAWTPSSSKKNVAFLTKPSPGIPTSSSVANGVLSNALPLIRSETDRTRLWPTTSSMTSSIADSPWKLPNTPLRPRVSRLDSWSATPASQPLNAVPTKPRSLKPAKRLWAVESLSAKTPTTSVSATHSTTKSTNQSCTGDQRTCAACQQDPALAEFCSAVTRSVRVPTSTQRGVPRPVAAPSKSTHNSNPEDTRETIPDAFTRLRTHPNFDRWKSSNRLEMLAEVVSRDANDNEDATDSSEIKQSESVSAEQSTPKKASDIAPHETYAASPTPLSEKSGKSEGTVSSFDLPGNSQWLKSDSDSSSSNHPEPPNMDKQSSFSSAKLDSSSTASSKSSPLRDSLSPARRSATSTPSAMDTDLPPSKRAKNHRVYVRSDAVSEALGILDNPSARSQPQEAQDSQNNRPCPCPWVNTSSRLPWPR
ncbi:hypothetical protein MYAM1_002404 [Malassezia yamatoensis]|uniref:BZIP domain-containing protein n=1 Tax=Malassezia yamatoensis TaxID=253288 RepID=A0AAJ6CH95_9BASI|nr:hypothetical protein MYAM1_002404 [Malassezia yamatoensis]